MKKTSFITSIFGTALLLIPLAVFAQDDRAPLIDVWLIEPKQGMTTQFEDAVKTHMAFRRDAGDSRSWETYSVSIGNNPMLYQFRDGGMNWADFDGAIAEDAEKGFGANWMANVDQYVDHYHHFIEEADYENSKWPADLGQQPYYGVTTWTWKQGSGPESGQARRKLSQIGIENDWDYNWLWLQRTGGAPVMMIVTGYDDFASMEPPEQTYYDFVSEVLGSEEEAGALFAQFAGGYTGSNYTIWAHRPDLSSPEASGADD